MLQRSVNEGFSGGEKKRNEIFQMAVLEPTLAILDETDSGLDIDALRVVSDGVNALRSPERAIIVVTHYQRLLNYIVPDHVHVLSDGRIVRSGGRDLALELEAQGLRLARRRRRREPASDERPADDRLGSATVSAASARARLEWLTAHRRDALDHFEATGFPTTREEAWRFTNIGPIAATAFELAPPDADGAEALAAANEIRESAATAVIVNGCFDETLSAFGALPLGVVVEALASSLDERGLVGTGHRPRPRCLRPSVRGPQHRIPRRRRACPASRKAPCSARRSRWSWRPCRASGR